MCSINWPKIRSDFPALRDYRYFFTASGGPLPRAVYEAATGYYRGVLEHGDTLWDANVDQREAVRARVAHFINADPEEVEFIPSLSAGMNILADMLAETGDVITSPLEFPSTTLPWLHRRPQGISWVTPLETGEVPVSKVLEARRSRSGVLLTSHVQYSNGFRQDLEALGREKDDYSLIVNATQSLGAFQVDVKAMRIDGLCSNSYKWLLSGYGAGVLYVSKRLLRRFQSALMAGWFAVEERDELRNDRFKLLSEAARFNPGSPSFPTIFSLGAAVRYLLGIGTANIEERVLELNRYLTNQLQLAGFEVLSPLADEKYRSGSSLVSLRSPTATVAELARRKILVTEKPEGMRVATHFLRFT